MKRLQLILLAAGALLALLAAVVFSKHGSSSIQPGVMETTPTSSQSSVISLSPDALVTQPSTPSMPAFNMNVKAAAVGDLATGVLLYRLHEDMRWPIASVTKLMTAEMVSELMDPEAIITLAPEDFAAGPSALSASLQPGDRYRVHDLLKVLLLPSSNEAAEAFARSYGRSAFMAAMNAKVAAWGLLNTHFDDPSGLSVANQSTPREFLELMRRVYTLHPEIFAITQNRMVAVQDLTSGSFKQFSSTNSFAGRAGFLGGKTGTTPEAGDNLVSIFQIGDKSVAILVFGAADRYAATESLLQFIQ